LCVQVCVKERKGYDIHTNARRLSTRVEGKNGSCNAMQCLM
jgi:hypothetical protein